MAENNKYNLVAENTQSTVVGEYVPDIKRVAHYQSEAELENAFIEQLKSQASMAIFLSIIYPLVL